MIEPSTVDLSSKEFDEKMIRPFAHSTRRMNPIIMLEVTLFRENLCLCFLPYLPDDPMGFPTDQNGGNRTLAWA